MCGLRVTDHLLSKQSSVRSSGAKPGRALVLGLGNPILTDDGVGVRIVDAVAKALPEGVSVDVVAVSVGGLSLMEQMVGYDRVILVDALHGCEGPPGTVHQLSVEGLRGLSPTQHSTCVHDMSFVTALELGERMGLDLPDEISIYGVAVENVVDFSEEPTPAVAAAVEPVVAAVLAELGFRE